MDSSKITIKGRIVFDFKNPNLSGNISACCVLRIPHLKIKQTIKWWASKKVNCFWIDSESLNFLKNIEIIHYVSVTGNKHVKIEEVDKFLYSPYKSRPLVMIAYSFLDEFKQEIDENYVNGESSLRSDVYNFLCHEKFTDVVLKCQDGSLKAHKIVLASRANVFDSLFSNNKPKPQVQTHVVICPFDKDLMSDVLEFMYKGKVVVNNVSMAEKLIKAGEHYELNDLKSACERNMVISSQNAFSTLMYSHSNNLSCLKKRALDFIVMNTKEVSEKGELLELAKSDALVAQLKDIFQIMQLVFSAICN